MSKIYSSKNKIKFTNISETYKVRRSFKGLLNDLHSSVITYVIAHYDGTTLYKQKVTRVLNIITYAVYASEPLPTNWKKNNPFVNIPDIDDDLIEEVLGDIYLTVDAIDWDIKPVEQPEPIITTGTKLTPITNTPNTTYKDVTVKETPTTDLYIQAPEIPQFDITKPWLQKQCGADLLTIYTTLPEIPLRQRDISITTDINKMTDDDLLKLYPNHFIQTRAKIMYTPQTNMDFDKDIGVILPIDDYSKEQVLENIIKYPHIYKLARHQPGLQVGTDFPSFYGWMEINGELVETEKVWDTLEISKWIPKNVDLIKEYIVRKYLLDKEYKGVNYKYPLFGTLDPFLTLFMPVEEYAKRGYDVVDLARQCVLSRISFKQSRSPILRRIQAENE